MSLAPPRALVLASASRSRAALLAAAGIAFIVAPAQLDENEIKHACRRDGRSAEDCAVELAQAKAVAVSRQHPGALVIGADQMLDCDGAWFDKPADPAAACRQLEQLRGRRHRLLAGVAVAENGTVLWQRLETAALTMRDFSDAFPDAYVAAAGESLCQTVGSYALEGPGVQLFQRVEGDYFTILGLPLLPLLGFLRERGALLP